jgi:hypothetical protein
MNNTGLYQSEKERKAEMRRQLTAEIKSQVLAEVRGHYVPVSEHQLALQRIAHLEYWMTKLKERTRLAQKADADKMIFDGKRLTAKKLVIQVLEMYGGEQGLTIREMQSCTKLVEIGGLKTAVQNLKKEGIIAGEPAEPGSNVNKYYLLAKRQK